MRRANSASPPSPKLALVAMRRSITDAVKPMLTRPNSPAAEAVTGKQISFDGVIIFAAIGFELDPFHGAIGTDRYGSIVPVQVRLRSPPLASFCFPQAFSKFYSFQNPCADRDGGAKKGENVGGGGNKNKAQNEHGVPIAANEEAA